MRDLDSERFIDRVAAYFNSLLKLFSSLFYLHTGVVLPEAGGVVFRWFSNAQNLGEMLPKDVLAPLLKQFPEMKRENTSLGDQFFYGYAIANDRPTGAFLVSFNQAIAMLGLVFTDIAKVQIPVAATVLQPKAWPPQ